nr:hypothetical protein Iba_scaffold32652CG0080 [Ipomoea batatas]GMD58955.1 hypothetical protein Iba_scaffold208438CG0010 [Ipomoea batatas]GME04022.1 hypothetical protein Iba_scaffold1512CG0020 [Ipomoea batatas]
MSFRACIEDSSCLENPFHVVPSSYHWALGTGSSQIVGLTSRLNRSRWGLNRATKHPKVIIGDVGLDLTSIHEAPQSKENDQGGENQTRPPGQAKLQSTSARCQANLEVNQGGKSRA